MYFLYNYIPIILLGSTFGIYELTNGIKIRDVKILHEAVFYILVVLFFIYSGFRYETGRDYQSYIAFFERCDTSANEFEIGYLWLNRIFKYLGFNYYCMQIAISLFCTVSISRLIKEKSCYPIFTLFIYFIVYYMPVDMAQTRQWIAMAILCNGLRKNIYNYKFLIYIYIASLFHITAWFALVPFFLMKIRFSKKILYCLFIVSVIAPFVFSGTMIIILKFLQTLQFLPSRLSYILKQYLGFEQDLHFGSGFGFLIKAIVIFSLIYFTRSKDTSNSFLLFLVSYLIFNCGINFVLLQRLSNYFEISFLALTAYNIKYSKKFLVKEFYYFYCICLVLYFLMLFVIFFFSPDAKDWFPYKSLLSY